MASPFELTIVNGLAGDPAVCLYFRQTGDSLLFDAGNLEPLSNRDLLKVKVVAVTHTHVDHFIGFDRLIRVNVPHFRTIEVVGPAGIIRNIQGKLAGYAWNLLEPNQVNIIVHEVSPDGSIESVHLSNSNQFLATNPTKTPAPKDPSTEPAKIPLRSSTYNLSAVSVDHGMQVLAYGLSMPDSMSVNKAQLDASALEPGPWISDLQKMAVDGKIKGSIYISGAEHDALQLAGSLLQPRSGQRLIYVTDMIFSEANIKQLKKLEGAGPNVIICEANYRHEHRQKAFDKFHLTTTQAALTAALLNAKHLQIFHISNLYSGDTDSSLAESDTAFTRLRQLDPVALWDEASMEFVSSK
jgi:ribonuclease Z